MSKTGLYRFFSKIAYHNFCHLAKYFTGCCFRKTQNESHFRLFFHKTGLIGVVYSKSGKVQLQMNAKIPHPFEFFVIDERSPNGNKLLEFVYRITRLFTPKPAHCLFSTSRFEIGFRLNRIPCHMRCKENVRSGSRGLSIGNGSLAVTSRAAADKCPEFRASARAFSSTSPPRVTLMNMAPGFF